MAKSRFIHRNSSFGSIREAGSWNSLPDANKQEKNRTQVINIDVLRAISRIVLRIKERIDAGETTRPGSDSHTPPAGHPSSPTTTSPNRGEDN